MLPIKSWSSEGNSWSCPLPTDRLRGILEAACHWGASRVTLVDAQGRERVKVDGKIITELRRGSRSNKSHPVAADVIVRREEIVRVYEELHLLYGMSETLTDQLTVAEGASFIDLILDKILSTVAASWAELELSDTGIIHRRVTTYTGPVDAERHPGHHLLQATVRSGGQTVGFIALGRPLTSDAFTSGESMLLNAISTLIANATRSAQLYEKLRKQTETLSARETHLRAVLDNVAEGIVTIDESGRIDSFNPAAEAIFEVAAKDVIGREDRDFINPPRADNSQHDP